MGLFVNVQMGYEHLQELIMGIQYMFYTCIFAKIFVFIYNPPILNSYKKPACLCVT